jgi:hypothetical protein
MTNQNPAPYCGIISYRDPDMIDSCQGKKAVFLPFNREKKGIFLDALPGH